MHPDLSGQIYVDKLIVRVRHWSNKWPYENGKVEFQDELQCSEF